MDRVFAPRVILGFAAGLASLLTATARAEEPSAEKSDLFEAEEGGYAHYRIPGVVVAGEGVVLAYCEARMRTRSDWGTIDVMMRRSTDGGETWGPPRTIVTPPEDVSQNPVALEQGLAEPGEITVNNPVAIVDREEGAVHFLYCVEYARCFYQRSDDGGETWSEPVEITGTFEPKLDSRVEGREFSRRSRGRGRRRGASG